MGGLSCIRRTLSALSYDGPNVAGPGYDRAEPKLSLDGAELLNISGDYESAEAVYTTEIESVARIVTKKGTGFVVREANGHSAEYGTTEDSCVLTTGTKKAREWRLKRCMDYHGNATTYEYVKVPTPGNISTCYLASIKYASNDEVGLRASRFIQCEYTGRPDLVVQNIGGDNCTWASLLAAIKLGVLSGPNDAKLISRSYDISYVQSVHTGDSQIFAITETSISDGKVSKLLPSLFGYTSTGVNSQQTFQEASPNMVRLVNGSGRQPLALFTANISSRCLADVACVQHYRAGQMFLKTYLARQSDDGTLTWTASDGPGAEASLPPINKGDEFPNIMCPDMNRDGRADIVIPYKDENDYIRFSISRCLGTRFEAASVKKTSNKWVPVARFMAIDHSGQGSVDIVQMFTFSGKQKLIFRNYLGINESGRIGIRDPVTTETNYNALETLDWFQFKHAGTGASGFTRIHAQDVGADSFQLKATTFTLANSGEIHELSTSLLGAPVSSRQAKASVLPCDINADGTQDIVLASVKYENYQVSMRHIMVENSF